MLLSDVEIVLERAYDDLIVLLLLLINNDQEGRLIILRVL